MRVEISDLDRDQDIKIVVDGKAQCRTNTERLVFGLVEKYKSVITVGHIIGCPAK